ncbi:MAG: hypothetical protein AAF547_03655 [Actinomycetota bacterium]
MPTKENQTTRRGRRLVAGLIAGGLALAACGADAADEVAVTDAQPAAAEAPADTPVTIDVLSAQTELGTVLVGPDGRTLYGFTNDVQAASTCYGTCADAWPPVIVSDDWTAGPGLDFGIFATTVRDDGQHQLVAGAWPLYYFAGDAVPGDVNGQGSGNVWFAVDVDGSLIQADPAVIENGADTAEDGAGAADGDQAAGEIETAATIVTTGDSELGQILVDETGLSLYGFLNDRDVGPTCEGACADAWPPIIVDGPDLPVGLDPEVFSVVERPDGSHQLQAGIWPLYLFAGDGAPGDINGQGSGNVWFLAAPDGSLIGAADAPSTPAVEAPATEVPATEVPAEDDGSTESGDGNGY